MTETGARQVHEALSDAAWHHFVSDSRRRKSHGSLVSKNRFTPLAQEQDDWAEDEETTLALENGNFFDCQRLIQTDPHFPARRVPRCWQKVRWTDAGFQVVFRRQKKRSTQGQRRARSQEKKSGSDETRPERKQTSSLVDIS